MIFNVAAIIKIDFVKGILQCPFVSQTGLQINAEAVSMTAFTGYVLGKTVLNTDFAIALIDVSYRYSSCEGSTC